MPISSIMAKFIFVALPLEHAVDAGTTSNPPTVKAITIADGCCLSQDAEDLADILAVANEPASSFDEFRRELGL